MIEEIYDSEIITEIDLIDFDLLILGLNSEIRSESILRILERNNQVSTKIVVYSLLSEVITEDILKNFNNFYVVYGSDNKISNRIKKYKDIFNSVKLENKKIGIDITGITVPDLFVIIKMLQDMFNSCNIYAFYSEPYNYSYEDYLYKNYEYSFGELNVIEIPGYNGSFDQKKPNVMIIILGFEDKVSRYIYTHDEPDRIIAINGFPSSIQKFKDISLVNNGILREVSIEKVYYSDAKNPFEVYNTMYKIIRENGNENYTIIPLGSKPMALGAALFQRDNKLVKVKYPVPQSYKHSGIREHVGAIWKYKIK